MREQISAALKDATLKQDKRRMCTLRLINAAVKDRDVAARGNGGQPVTDEEVMQILSKMVKQREESAKIYEEAGRLELAKQEREEIAIINDFLPRQLDDTEISNACASIVEKIGAHGLRDMGKTMSALKAQYAGRMDFGRASTIVKELLQ